MMATIALAGALGWLTTPAELAARPAGSVTVLDARPASDYRQGHVPGAVRIDWSDFRDGWGRTGKLSADLSDLTTRLEEYGIDDRRVVVVYGRGRDGWGEEGRIAWMLHYLGHSGVSVLDGGLQAWAAAGLPISRAGETALRAHFEAHPVALDRASAGDVEAMRHGRGIVLDVRTREEYLGATLHWESRGGHIPGAIHLEWKDLLDAQGRLDPAAARRRLAAAGVDASKPIVTYCTAGVRAAEAWLLLRSLGFPDVRNYDGSWYEWSADDDRPISTGASP